MTTCVLEPVRQPASLVWPGNQAVDWVDTGEAPPRPTVKVCSMPQAQGDRLLYSKFHCLIARASMREGVSYFWRVVITIGLTEWLTWKEISYFGN